MKKYIKPISKVVNIQPATVIATSGDTTTLGISNTEYSGTFNARSSRLSTWEEQESNE